MRVTLKKMSSLRGVRKLPALLDALEDVLPETGLDMETEGEIHICLVTRPRIVALNAMHLHHQGPTDVITYDLRGAGDFMPPDESWTPVLAEIFVCPDVARRQSSLFGETPSRELFRYAVHGLLHLAGEDDLTPEALASMRKAEQRLIDSAIAKGHKLDDFLR